MNMAITKTYSLTLRHIGMVTDMAERLSQKEKTKISQGEVLRLAIEELWEKLERDEIGQA